MSETNRATPRTWVGATADAYERWLVPALFEGYAHDLCTRVAAVSPARVLELAAGTGVVTRALVADPAIGEVIATDLDPGMIEVGRRLAPGAEWREADAEQLPFRDGEFDAIACQFGVMFFPDKLRAYAEAARVLSADGALFVNVWDTVAHNDYAAALVVALERVLPDDPPRFLVSLPYGYADPERIQADLVAGGFRSITIESVAIESSAPSARDVTLGYCLGTPLHAQLSARGDAEDLIDRIGEVMAEELGTGPMTGTLRAYVASAKPGGTS